MPMDMVGAGVLVPNPERGIGAGAGRGVVGAGFGGAALPSLLLGLGALNYTRVILVRDTSLP